MPGAPPRVHQVEIGVDDQEYAPVPGIWELRRAVAELYNELYRQGKRSQYTERNVCICGGGRASLTRAVAALGEVNLGHFLPDYTAYEELLDIFKLFTSIPILLDGASGYHFGLDELEREITGRGLSALLLSNPCNPTGKVIQGDELEGWVGLAREVGCTLLIDEFYSHYVWADTADGSGMVSAARLRGGRGRRSGRAVRRAHQELALPRLAHHLDRRPASGDRGGLEQRIVPRRRGQQAAAALGRAAARSRPWCAPRPPPSGRRFCGSARSWATGFARRACGSISSPRAPSTGGATSPRCRRRSIRGWRSSSGRSSGR